MRRARRRARYGPLRKTQDPHTATVLARGSSLGGDVDFGHRLLSIVRTVVCVGTKIEVPPGKTHASARTIDLDPDTLDVLSGRRDRHRQQFGGHDINRALFTKPDGELLHPQTLSQTFNRAVAKTDLPRISLHILPGMQSEAAATFAALLRAAA